MKTEIRKMTFGKYKGQPVLLVIAEHIGYIMWCFENLKWFRLNEDEQKFYDWQAIAIKKYGMPMIFPTEAMYKHVKDRKALDLLETPYQFIGDSPYIPKDNELSPLLIGAGVIRKRNAEPLSDYDSDGRPWWFGLHQCAVKDVDNMEESEVEKMERDGVTPPMPPIC